MMIVCQQKGLGRHGPWSIFASQMLVSTLSVAVLTDFILVIILTSSLLRFWCTQIHTFLRHGSFHSFWSCSQHVAPHSFGFSALVAENPQKRWKMMEAWPCYSSNMFFHVFSILWGCLDLRGFLLLYDICGHSILWPLYYTDDQLSSNRRAKTEQLLLRTRACRIAKFSWILAIVSMWPQKLALYIVWWEYNRRTGSAERSGQDKWTVGDVKAISTARLGIAPALIGHIFDCLRYVMTLFWLIMFKGRPLQLVSLWSFNLA